MKKRLFALLLVLALALSVTACGFTGDEDAPASEAPATDAPAEEPTEEEPAAANDGTLVLYTNTEYRTLVQWGASDNNCFEIMNNVFEGLYRLDADHNPEPALAESYDLSEDGLTYTFHLRDGIVWSNGDPITADDFVFAWLKLMESSENGYAFIMCDYIVNGYEFQEGAATAEEVGVKALDEKTLEVNIKTPTPFFLRIATMPMYFPLNEAYVTEQGDAYGLTADAMIYSGPYLLTEFDPAAGSTMVKNPDYWDADSVQIETVKTRVIKDQAAALNAYQADEIHRVNLTAADVATFADDPEFSSYTDFRNFYLQFSTTSANVANVNIRKALGYAIDRELLASSILADGSTAAGGVVCAGMTGDGTKTFRELNGNLCPFDAASAKEYWDKGVEEMGGTAPELTMLAADDSLTSDIATFLQDQFRTNLGIEVTINILPYTARNELMDGDNYEFAITAWGGDYDDAMTFLDLWTEGSPYRGNYKDPDYDKLIADAKVEADSAARLEMLLEAEQILLDRDAVISPLYDRGFSILTKSNVKGLIVHPVGSPLELKHAYFE